MMVSWVYGVGRFVRDVNLMLGDAPNRFYRILGYPVNAYWKLNWMIFTPLLLAVCCRCWNATNTRLLTHRAL